MAKGYQMDWYNEGRCRTPSAADVSRHGRGGGRTALTFVTVGMTAKVLTRPVER